MLTWFDDEPKVINFSTKGDKFDHSSGNQA